MTREEFASFLRRYAAGDSTEDEWTRYAVQHYEDIATESARSTLVRLVQQTEGGRSAELSHYLDGIAASLLQPFSDSSFYFRGGEAGILREALPLLTATTISYEPYRSGSDYDLHEAIRAGECPICEYMHEGRRHRFTVVSAPDYGQLEIQLQ